MLKGKRIFIAAVLIIAVLSSMMVVNAATTTTKLKVDGNLISVKAAPIIVGSEVFVPARETFEALGATITPQLGGKGTHFITSDMDIVLFPNSASVSINNSNSILTSATRTVKNVMMVPVSLLKSTLGVNCIVTGNNSIKTVSITYFTKMTGTLKIGGSTTIQPISQSAADALMDMNNSLSVTVAGGGSGAGIKGCMDGTFNIGMSSAELTSSDKSTYPGINEYKIGKDGIAVILNPSNPVKTLTKKQVIDIFTGKITNWKDVGGKNAAIFIQTREATSGTLKAFKELALEKANIADTATPQTSNGMIIQAVSGNKNSIGFLSMGYLDSSVKAVSIDKILPTRVNALSGKWPYIRPLLILTNGKPSGLTAKFMNYLTSPDGQDMLSDEGYLPLNAKD